MVTEDFSTRLTTQCQSQLPNINLSLWRGTFLLIDVCFYRVSENLCRSDVTVASVLFISNTKIKNWTVLVKCVIIDFLCLSSFCYYKKKLIRKSNKSQTLRHSVFAKQNRKNFADDFITISSFSIQKSLYDERYGFNS